jgi:hypothetical protein
MCLGCPVFRRAVLHPSSGWVNLSEVDTSTEDCGSRHACTFDRTVRSDQTEHTTRRQNAPDDHKLKCKRCHLGHGHTLQKMSVVSVKVFIRRVYRRCNEFVGYQSIQHCTHWTQQLVASLHIRGERSDLHKALLEEVFWLLALISIQLTIRILTGLKEYHILLNSGV